MTPRIGRAKVGIALLTVLCISGCRQTTGDRGVTRTEFTWWVATTNSVPGIDKGAVTVVTFKAGPPEGVAFVLWSDLSSTYGSGGVNAEGASYAGYHSGPGDRRVDFRVKSSDGKSGSMTIAGDVYDLSNGSLFLVSTRAQRPVVAQIMFDVRSFPQGNAIRDLARSNPQIRGFF